MIQKSPEWFESRNGKFTASEYWKLFTSGVRKDDYFGKVAIGYIK